MAHTNAAKLVIKITKIHIRLQYSFLNVLILTLHSEPLDMVNTLTRINTIQKLELSQCMIFS